MIHDLTTLLAVVVGGVIAIFTNYFFQRHQLSIERRHLAWAFLGELTAIKFIVEKRQYIEGIRQAIAITERTNQPFPYHFVARRDYFLVFKQNVSKIGMLESPLPELIASFYTQAQSILEDMDSMSENRFANLPPEEFVVMLKQLLELFISTQQLGDQIISEIRRKYPQKN